MWKLDDNPIRSKYYRIKHTIIKSIIRFLANDKPIMMNCKYKGWVNLGGHGYYWENNKKYKEKV